VLQVGVEDCCGDPGCARRCTPCRGGDSGDTRGRGRKSRSSTSCCCTCARDQRILWQLWRGKFRRVAVLHQVRERDVVNVLEQRGSTLARSRLMINSGWHVQLRAEVCPTPSRLSPPGNGQPESAAGRRCWLRRVASSCVELRRATSSCCTRGLPAPVALQERPRGAHSRAPWARPKHSGVSVMTIAKPTSSRYDSDTVTSRPSGRSVAVMQAQRNSVSSQISRDHKVENVREPWPKLVCKSNTLSRYAFWSGQVLCSTAMHRRVRINCTALPISDTATQCNGGKCP